MNRKNQSVSKRYIKSIRTNFAKISNRLGTRLSDFHRLFERWVINTCRSDDVGLLWSFGSCRCKDVLDDNTEKNTTFFMSFSKSLLLNVLSSTKVCYYEIFTPYKRKIIFIKIIIFDFWHYFKVYKGQREILFCCVQGVQRHEVALSRSGSPKIILTFY